MTARRWYRFHTGRFAGDQLRFGVEGAPLNPQRAESAPAGTVFALDANYKGCPFYCATRKMLWFSTVPPGTARSPLLRTIRGCLGAFAQGLDLDFRSRSVSPHLSATSVNMATAVCAITRSVAKLPRHPRPVSATRSGS